MSHVFAIDHLRYDENAMLVAMTGTLSHSHF